MTTKNCSNKFLEDDGFCTQCGQNHLKSKPVSRKSVVSFVDSKVDDYSNTINSTPHYAAARKLVEDACELYGIECRVVFKNSASKCYATKDSKGYVIVFGYQLLDHWAINGYKEAYASTQNVTRAYVGNTGAIAGQLTAAHEFAHVMLLHRFGTHPLEGRSKYHGPTFCEQFSEIIELLVDAPTPKPRNTLTEVSLDELLNGKNSGGVFTATSSGLVETSLDEIFA